MKQKIILDVDTGHDDAAAIILAAGSPEIEIVGIVAVSGNQVREKTLNNTLNVCDHLGIDAPVYSGLDVPLVRERITAGNIHGETGLDGPVFAARKKEAEAGYGVNFIIETVMNNPGEITLVPTGPLTDIAMAIRMEPKVATYAKQIVAMGGSMGEGNVTASAEFNIYADPEAAEIVFASGANVVLMPLDVTYQVQLTQKLYDKYRALSGKAVEMFCASMGNYIESCRRFGYDYPAMHDPCCVAYIIDPSIFEFERRDMHVELRGSHTYGRTVGRLCKKDGILVGVKAQVPRFWELMDRAFQNLG